MNNNTKEYLEELRIKEDLKKQINSSTNIKNKQEKNKNQKL